MSQKNIILHDLTAEKIWEKEKIKLKRRSKSKWLAYYLAMRSVTFDEWVKKEIKNHPHAIVLHIGCGMDSRFERVEAKNIQWYDIDFKNVIKERHKYFTETNYYHMLSADMRTSDWKNTIKEQQDAIVILEGVSMYFQPKELTALLSNLAQHFHNVKLLMDCYSEYAAKASKYRNPINDVGVNIVYGYDIPHSLARQSGFVFEKEHSITSQRYINELRGIERKIFQYMYAGQLSQSMYKIYEFKKEE